MAGNHIVPMPKGFLAVRILQVVFALVVVGLTAFLISNTLGFVFSATGFGIFCGILTLIIVTYDLVSERSAKAAYNMWAVLGLDILMVVFWLSAMGSLAALRAAFTIPVDITYYKRDIVKRYVYAWAGDTYLAILAASAGVAAIELILFIISLVMFSARLHRHRNANSPATRGPDASEGTIHVQPEKIELAQQGNNSYVQPAPGYSAYQQPVPAQPMQAAQPMYQQPTGSTTFSPVPNPYQPAMSPPPQQYPTSTATPAPQHYGQPAPHYQVQGMPQGYAEAPAAEYQGKA